MPSRNKSSIRSIAELTGYSVATVSEALKDSDRVKRSTKERILAVAREVGYRANPKVQAAMATIRSTDVDRMRGTIALVDIFDRDKQEIHPFHEQIMKGIREASDGLGFATELFIVGRDDTEQGLRRLNRILKSRNVDGLIVLPFSDPVDFSPLNFERISAIHLDFCLMGPKLHHVCPDHYASMADGLEHLSSLGYRRPGLYMLRRKDERLLFRWTTGFQSHYLKNRLAMEPEAVRQVEQLERESFLGWFESYRPDVVLGHFDLLWEWLEDAGYSVPGDVGFFCLNCTTEKRDCSGLDLNPRQIGVSAVEAVVDLVNRREKGVPEFPRMISVLATLKRGSSLRAKSS